jgi:hypothetical protein
VRAPVENDAGPIGLDKGIERVLDDGLRHSLAIRERLIGPRLRPLSRRQSAASDAEAVA